MMTTLTAMTTVEKSRPRGRIDARIHRFRHHRLGSASSGHQLGRGRRRATARSPTAEHPRLGAPRHAQTEPGESTLAKQRRTRGFRPLHTSPVQSKYRGKPVGRRGKPIGKQPRPSRPALGGARRPGRVRRQTGCRHRRCGHGGGAHAAAMTVLGSRFLNRRLVPGTGRRSPASPQAFSWRSASSPAHPIHQTPFHAMSRHR